MHMYFVFGNHVHSSLSLNTYVFPISQAYFFCHIYANNFWNCSYVCSHTKYYTAWGFQWQPQILSFVSHICPFTFMIPLIFLIRQSYLFYCNDIFTAIHKYLTFSRHICSFSSMAIYSLFVKESHMSLCGHIVAKWIACGTLNTHIVGSNLSAASWLTM